MFRDDDLDTTYIRSSAVMEAFYYCLFPYWVFYYFLLIIPAFLRDWTYTLFSRNRSLIASKASIEDIDDKFRFEQKKE